MIVLLSELLLQRIKGHNDMTVIVPATLFFNPSITDRVPFIKFDT